MQLIVMCEPRMVLSVIADKSGDHYHGDVIDMVPDGAVTAHYHQRNPFVVIRVPGDRSDWEFLLEPLQEQIASDTDAGPAIIYRKRYGLKLGQLSSQIFNQLMTTGKCSVSDTILESITESRSAA